MARRLHKYHAVTNFCVWVALVCLITTPFWVVNARAENSRELPPINSEALSQLVAELQSSPPPALDIRDGTQLNDLQSEMQSGRVERLSSLGLDNTAQQDYADVMQSSPRRTNLKQQLAKKFAQKQTQDDAGEVLDLTGLSPLEANYSRRASQRLIQFGYDIFTGADVRVPAPATLGDNYVLGPGDRLLVVLRGANSRTENYLVGDDGKVIVDSIRPITAAGRSLGDVSREVEQEISASLMDTQAFVSLSKLRAVNVQVIGEVMRPGRQSLSSYGGVVDALNAAGGVRKTGSLRRIQLSRADGTQRALDLYQLLLTGARDVDIQLKDGDRLMVPPVGETLAVAGNIKRAGIYELPQQNPDITLQQALYLAGETHQPTGLRFMRIRTDQGGNEQFVSLVDPEAALLSDQDVVMAQSRGDAPRRVVSVMGNVRAPGRVPLDEARTLSALLGDGANIADNTYPLMGLIERKNNQTLEKEYVAFNPADALAGEGPSLREGDKVKLFSENEVDELTALPVAVGTSKAAMFDSGAGLDAAKENLTPTQRVIQDHVVTLRGAVARPGNYPIAQETSLSELLGAAGGMTREADKASVEIVSYRTDDMGRRAPSRDSYDITRENPRSIMVPVGASVRINPKTDLVQREGARINGEVARPGKYDIMRGEKLSSLIARAGGLTGEAYPAGTVFMRSSARRQEAAQYKTAAQQLEQSLARMLARDDKRPNAEQIDMTRQLANELRNAPAVGRITVEADPDVLRLKPEEDVLLEPGDEIVIPPRRQTVAVSGEVHAPANLQFISGKDAGVYLREAGGFTRFADEGHAFVVQPNGASRPLRVSAWNHQDTSIVPGSTIVVPRDPDHYNDLEMVSGIGNILSQLAVSTAAIASINDNNN